MTYRQLKRGFDIFFAAGGLLVLAPVMLITAVLIRFNMGHPVLFRQERPGLNGKIFTVLKFRTMRDAYDEEGRPLPITERITPLGRLLRKTSLDELPQLLNVLKGEMSFVGPRPLLTSYLPHYTERERKRHEVRPGITGLAQVVGRNRLGWDERLELDAKYVETQSLALDMNIVLKTVIKVLKREDVLDVSHGPLTKHREGRANP